MDFDWKSWWFHPNPPFEARPLLSKTCAGDPPAIHLDGSENAHWKLVVSTPHMVPDATAVPALGVPFKEWLVGRDVSSNADDWHDRERMKHLVYSAGWLRAGLVGGKNGYIDALRGKHAIGGVLRAALALERFSEGRLKRLDLQPIERAWERHWGVDREPLTLEGTELAAFLRVGGSIPAYRAFTDRQTEPAE